MDYERVYIATTVPETHLHTVLEAIASTGAGVVGHYTHCSFSVAGIGRFKPDDAANPAVGARLIINEEPEIRVETFCERDDLHRVVAALRAAHPYEEPVIYALPLLI